MRTIEALRIIADGERPKGYMVHWERKDGNILTSDYFPDKHGGEELIQSEDEAWRLAQKLAAATVGRFVNVYVVDDKFSPVSSYRERMIENRRPATESVA